MYRDWCATIKFTFFGFHLWSLFSLSTILVHISHWATSHALRLNPDIFGEQSCGLLSRVPATRSLFCFQRSQPIPHNTRIQIHPMCTNYLLVRYFQRQLCTNSDVPGVHLLFRAIKSLTAGPATMETWNHTGSFLQLCICKVAQLPTFGFVGISSHHEKKQVS